MRNHITRLCETTDANRLTRQSPESKELLRSFPARNDGFIIALLLILFSNISSAQDVHSSQYFNTPLSLNPALTGKVDGTFRLGVNYRNQWFGLMSGRNSYSTPSFFGDVPIRFKSKSVIGVGLNIVSDKSSGGRLSVFSGMVSTAYHQAMGKTKNHFFSFGLQFGYLQKKLDLDDIRLGDQISLQDASFTGGSRDNLNGSDGGFDVNLGFDWNSKFSEKVNLHAGYAVFHVSQPKVFFSVDGDKLPMRHVINVGAEFQLSQHFGLNPMFVYMAQAKASETYLGLAADIGFSDNAGMQLGVYYRAGDAVAPYLGFDIKGFGLGISYDVTTSSLEQTSGGIEISLLYIGKYVAVPDVLPSMYCPRF